MQSLLRRKIIIIALDLLIALFAFWISRYFGDLPRWYWLVLSSVVWVVIGLITNKLQFSKYKRVGYLFSALFIVDAATGALLFLSYRHFIADYYYDYSILLATGLIFILECLLYYGLRVFVYQKIPYLYEEATIDESVEPIKVIKGEEDEFTEDVTRLIEAFKSGDYPSVEALLALLSESSTTLDCSDPEEVLRCGVKVPSLIIHRRSLNDVRHINTLLSFTNYKLCDRGFVVCKCVTSTIRREMVLSQMPRPLNHIVYFFDYIHHRVIPKISGIKSIYYLLTKGERRVLTRVEVLGRLYRAGFDVVYERILDGRFYVVAKKIQEPIRHDKPSNGPLVRLKRNGKSGKIIGVYKFRTMHAYSEYLQPYMYKTEGLAKDGGRYGNDYRINKTGAFMRKVFIDELPMLINWFKGDLKLVGVRPLSNHYFSLYTKDFQELRLKVKPGLLPPFYADRPNSIEEKQASERRYIEAYLKNPLLTDWCYFWRIFNSIVFKGTRSE